MKHSESSLRARGVGVPPDADVVRAHRIGRLLPASAVVLPALIIAYVLLRLIPGDLSFGLAQVVFLTPIALATALPEIAYSFAPAGVERRGWGVLSLTLGIVLLSQSYYSWYQVTVSKAGPSWPSVFDALNVLAAVMIVAGIAHMAGVAHLTSPQQFRLFFDGVAFAVITFTALYSFSIRPMDPSLSWPESARLAAYSLVGVLIIFGIVWLIASSTPGIERSLMSLVGSALLVYGGAIVMWPQASALDSSSIPVLWSALVNAVFMSVYCVLAFAALLRLRRAEEPWRVDNLRPVNTQGVWVSTLLALYVLVGVGFIGWWVYHHKTEPDALMYLSCAMIATLSLVARTGATAIETVLARSEAGTDPVTGVLGASSFLHRCEEALSHAERVGQSLSVILLDVDAFSQVNAALGHAGGDRVLTQIASAVASEVAGEGEVYRLSADEFAVICRMNEPGAAAIAAEVLEVIRDIVPAEGLRLSASIGVAGCGPGECDREELIRRAKAAEAWAKYHGKGRVVRFDERIVRALGVEERLREHEDRNSMEMIRAIALAADARDPRNYYHSRNVAALSVMFSEALELEPENVRRIEIAALLHDCGKLALPDSLLAEVLRTSRQQLAAREHATIGETLSQSIGMPGVPLWIRHHHERWDGAGYPDGLVGEAVPLESRIIALADAYDALTSGARRSSPMSRGAALQEIDLGMGSRFDPMLAEHFIVVVGQTASLGWSDEWAS